MDVKSWNLSYGMFEDNPDKVAAAARALRRRDAAPQQHGPRAGQPGVYDVLVQEAAPARWRPASSTRPRRRPARPSG